jgi:uncharacterized protein YjbI with pentapeptide repeats
MTPFIKATVSVLTLCGTILTGGVVGKPSYGSQGTQGTSFNGMSLQGENLNGMNMQGVALNGVNMQGVSLNGQGVQGVSLNGQGAQGTGFNGSNIGLDGRVVGIELPTPSAEATR